MERHSQYFKLSDIRRVFPELFPIRQIGFMNMNAMPRYHLYAGKLEFCLRFSEKEEFSDDIVNNVKYRIPFPNVFLKTPDLLHGTRFKTDRQAVYFAYDPALYERMRQGGLLTPPFLWHFRMTPEISFVLKHIRELADSLGEYGIADRIDTLVLKLLQDMLLERNERNTIHKIPTQEERIQRIATYLQLNFLNEIDYETLYRKNGFSRRNFFRCWKQYYNLSPARYVLQLKMEYACNQLRETDLSVGELAEELKLKNRCYLSSLFRKIYGKTPLCYRRESRLNSNTSA